MHVIAIQFDIAWEDRAANHAKVAAMLERQPPPRGAMLVLPEMFASGFSMDVAKTAQDESRPDERFVASLCDRYGVWGVAGVVSRGVAGMGRNEAVVFSPEAQLVTRYCKMHPFSLAGENRCCEAGRELVTFDCAGFTVAPFICYDLRFPELFRVATRRGANVFLVIANWPDARAEQRLVLLRARAIENQAYVVGVNRVGDDPGNHYTGQSCVIDPRGDVLAQADDREQLLAADLDLAALHDYRTSFPWLRDMRDDLLPPR
jgi:predicted amidohydrolase